MKFFIKVHIVFLIVFFLNWIISFTIIELAIFLLPKHIDILIGIPISSYAIYKVFKYFKF